MWIKSIENLNIAECIDRLHTDGLLVLTSNQGDAIAAVLSIPGPELGQGQFLRELTLLDEQWKARIAAALMTSRGKTEAPASLGTPEAITLQRKLPQYGTIPGAGLVDEDDSENEGANTPSIEQILSKYPRQTQELVNEVMKALESPGVRRRTSRTGGGDIRHFYRRWNFSCISLRRDGVLLGLRVGKAAKMDSDFSHNNGKGNSPHFGYVRLIAGKPIPEKVLGWIEVAKDYTRANE